MEPWEPLEILPREGGGRCRFRVPDGSPYFDGHFPGRPLLPGVAHFGLVLATIARVAAGEARFLSVEALRFRKPLGPGDLVEVDVEGTDAPGRARFALRSGAERISHGDGRIGPAGPPGEPTPTPGRRSGAFDPSLPLPHRSPARLVERLVDADEQRGAAAIVVPAGNPFLAGATVPSFLGFEMAAQTAAGLEALARLRSGADPSPRVGYLVAVRDARLHVEHLPVDRPLRAEVARTEGVHPLTFYRMTLTDGARTLVEGTIATYIDAPGG